MPYASPNPANYTLGRGVLSVGRWNGVTPPVDVDYVDLGNCPKLDVEVTETKLEHYLSRAMNKLKDKVVTLESGYNLNFELDELSINNLQMFLRASIDSGVILGIAVPDQEYAFKFVSNNPVGPNDVWQFWRCRLAPGAAMGLIADTWQSMQFKGEGLADIANHPTTPWFNVWFATTTTVVTTTTADDHDRCDYHDWYDHHDLRRGKYKMRRTKTRTLETTDFGSLEVTVYEVRPFDLLGIHQKIQAEKLSLGEYERLLPLCCNLTKEQLARLYPANLPMYSKILKK